MPKLSKDEFMAKIQEIGTCEDDVQRRNLLSELSGGVSEVYDDNDTLSKSNKQYAEDNEILRKANMKMWLESTSDSEGEKPTEEEEKPEEKEEKLEFKDLFNEKGELK